MHRSRRCESVTETHLLSCEPTLPECSLHFKHRCTRLIFAPRSAGISEKRTSTSLPLCGFCLPASPPRLQYGNDPPQQTAESHLGSHSPGDESALAASVGGAKLFKNLIRESIWGRQQHPQLWFAPGLLSQITSDTEGRAL